MTTEELNAKYDRLFELVRKMRGRQKEFFKYRASVDLQESRRLERQVDTLIADEVKRKQSQQKELF